MIEEKRVEKYLNGRIEGTQIAMMFGGNNHVHLADAEVIFVGRSIAKHCGLHPEVKLHKKLTKKYLRDHVENTLVDLIAEFTREGTGFEMHADKAG